eukprot:COSAG02_NODE_963_length_15604_cov_10.737117_5_plen_64_part_00
MTGRVGAKYMLELERLVLHSGPLLDGSCQFGSTVGSYAVLQRCSFATEDWTCFARVPSRSSQI